MAKQVRYRGEFLSRKGARWKAEIWQESETAFAEVGDLDFDATEAVTIEWSSVAMEDVICGSSATLTILSPGDRTYTDLYTEEPGQIGLDLYREGALYWSGTLDSEFYEEPYEMYSGYPVRLTFSDFGVLDRLQYRLEGEQTLRDILTDALSLAKIGGTIDDGYISTKFTDDTFVRLSDISVRSDNFSDEEGARASYKEVIEGMFQPLGIKMMQREGRVWLYDINGIYYSAGTPIRWSGTSQTLGTNKVANSIKVTFSPYGADGLDNSEVEYTGVTDSALKNFGNDDVFVGGGAKGYYSYYLDYKTPAVGGDWDENLLDFTMFLSTEGEGLKSIGADCRYFKVITAEGKEKDKGVAYLIVPGQHRELAGNGYGRIIHTAIPNLRNTEGMYSEVLTTKRVYLPKLSESDAHRYTLLLSEEVCIDARYNPFSGSTEGNEETQDKDLKWWSGFVFIPAKVTLYNAQGEARYHYSNKAHAEGAIRGTLSNFDRGEWKEGAATNGECWLEWYDPDDLKESCGIRGFQSNRHCIGRPDGKFGRIKPFFFESFKKAVQGERIPYPPEGGWIEVQIQAGVVAYDYEDTNEAQGDWFGRNTQWHNKGIYKKVRWLLYKTPKISIFKQDFAEELRVKDIEYKGTLNRHAKEEIKLDTICGTLDAPHPLARGVYLRKSDGAQITELKRAGVTDHPEKLLINTLYSQYGGRKTTLSGEAEITAGFGHITERNQGDRRFIRMGETQNLINDTAEITICEIRPDEYNG